MTALRAAPLAAAALLAACAGAPRPVDPGSVPDAVPRVEPRSARGNPPFYEVAGERYAVLPSAAGYQERGVASWYGPDFHGGTTSSGERYDMYAMTAAHRTLPLPSYVRVTNLANGRSVVVRVNDRGPFKKNRVIDLSYAAAQRLDMVRDGTAVVEVQSVGPDSRPPPAAAGNGRLYAQAGAFRERENAERLARRLEAAGFAEVRIMTARQGGAALHRVRIGPVAGVAAYDALVGRLQAAGFGPMLLALD